MYGRLRTHCPHCSCAYPADWLGQGRPIARNPLEEKVGGLLYICGNIYGGSRRAMKELTYV